MKTIQKVIIFLIIILAIALIPNTVKAVYQDTFTTGGINVNKIIASTDGTIDFQITNIELTAGHTYKWAIAKTNQKEDVQDWNILGQFNTDSKTAVLNVTPSNYKMKEILKTTDEAYLYLKDETDSETYKIDALKVDLSLPVLGGINITNTVTASGETYTIPNIYEIGQMYFKFVKITDDNIIQSYEANNGDLSKLELADVSEAPISWETYNGYGGTISNIKKPKETGIYYLWAKIQNSSSKAIIGYTVIKVEAVGPKVSAIVAAEPEDGTYGAPQKVTIRVEFDREISGSIVPTLKIRFGDSEVRELTNGIYENPYSWWHYIEYTYNIQNTDVGQLEIVDLVGGNIKDKEGNDAILSCPLITGKSIVASGEGTANNNTDNKDENVGENKVENAGENKVENVDEDRYANVKVPIEAVEYNGHYYLAFNQKKTWQEAQTYCESVGGHLVSFNSKEESDFVIEYLKKSFKGRYWIGLKLTENKTYAWITGEQLSYVNWGPGEPNNQGNIQDSALICTDKVNSINPGQWDDAESTGKWYFVCEWDGGVRQQVTQDDTIISSKLPQTGENILIIACMVIVMISGVVFFVKNRKYKDIG